MNRASTRRFPPRCGCGSTALPPGLVGGSVRDLLLGKVPSDFDLVTSAKPEELAQLFADFRAVGASFGVSLIGVGGVSLEVATAREERNYLDGRHPELVRYTADLECDVQRRDFTINALWYDPAEGEVCDCVGGIDDLERGVVRTVGDAGAAVQRGLSADAAGGAFRGPAPL